MATLKDRHLCSGLEGHQTVVFAITRTPLLSLQHGCAKVAHCVPLGDVTSPTTVAHNISMTCSEHREALTAAPTSD